MEDQVGNTHLPLTVIIQPKLKRRRCLADAALVIKKANDLDHRRLPIKRVEFSHSALVGEWPLLAHSENAARSKRRLLTGPKTDLGKLSKSPRFLSSRLNPMRPAASPERLPKRA
jgi:hypothetical protein